MTENLDKIIYNHVVNVLDANYGNRTHSAEALGVSNKWVYLFIKKHNLDSRYKSKFGPKSKKLQKTK